MSGGGGGERTEKASKKKKEDARKKGQVIRSHDMSVALSMIIFFAFLQALFNRFVGDASGLMEKYLSESYLVKASESVNAAGVMSLYKSTAVDALNILLPVLALALVGGFVFSFLQTGFLFTPSAILPKFSKINPLEGFKRIFSTRSLMEMLKALLKVILLCWFVYGEYRSMMSEFPNMMTSSVSTAFLRLMQAGLGIGLKMGAVLMVIAMMDYLYQWWRYEKDLMMTKQEVKEEYRQLEGDPKIKGQIRQKQRQMSRMRMMKSVPEADVIITNPTHYAVAIRYKEGEDTAPTVLAKGKDYVAQKIKETGRENGVEIVENKPVAQALYAACEVGDQIPQDLYRAVAEILVYVYKLKNRGKGEKL